MGERVLPETALALKASMSPSDLLARIGRDEFAATGLTLRQSGADAVNVGGHRETTARGQGLITVSLSCGVGECSAGGTDQPSRSPDQALYDAMRKGKNRVAVKGVSSFAIVSGESQHGPASAGPQPQPAKQWRISCTWIHWSA